MPLRTNVGTTLVSAVAGAVAAAMAALVEADPLRDPVPLLLLLLPLLLLLLLLPPLLLDEACVVLVLVLPRSARVPRLDARDESTHFPLYEQVAPPPSSGQGVSKDVQLTCIQTTHACDLPSLLCNDG